MCEIQLGSLIGTGLDVNFSVRSFKTCGGRCPGPQSEVGMTSNSKTFQHSLSNPRNIAHVCVSSNYFAIITITNVICIDCNGWHHSPIQAYATCCSAMSFSHYRNLLRRECSYQTLVTDFLKKNCRRPLFAKFSTKLSLNRCVAVQTKDPHDSYDMSMPIDKCHGG